MASQSPQNAEQAVFRNRELETGTGPWPEATREMRAYIREHISSTRRPEDLDGLSWRKPVSLDGYKIVGRFDVRRDRNVRDRSKCIGCALDPAHPPFSGYIVWFPDGYLRIVGSTCGPNHFEASDTDFHAAIRTFTEREKREKRVRLLEDLEPYLPDAISTAEVLLASKQVKETERVDVTIARDLPEVRGAWQMASTNGGLLFRETMRDRPSAFTEAGGRSSMGDVERTTFGQIRGLTFVRQTKTCKRLLDTATSHLVAARNLISGTRPFDMDDPIQAGAIGHVSSGIKCVEKAVEAMDALPALFEVSAMTAVIRYISAEPDHTKTFRSYQLQRLEGGGAGFLRVLKDGSRRGFVFRPETDEVDMRPINLLAATMGR